MNIRRVQKKAVTQLILLGFLLRVVVPAGFMPAALSDGWYLELCPDGMSAGAMMALLGDAHHHHHAAAGGRAFVQCDLGSGLASSVTQNCADTTEVLPFNSVLAVAAPHVHRRYNAHLSFRSRAPPIS